MTNPNNSGFSFNAEANQVLKTAVEEIPQLMTAGEEIIKEELPEYVKALKLANLYIKYSLSLNAKAREILEKMVDSGTTEPVMYLGLGDICKNCGLSVEAKEHYTKAISQASAINDNQVIVAAKAGLAKIEAVLGNTEQAKSSLQEAQAEFEALKDVEKWEELNEMVKDFTSQEQRLVFLSGCGICTTMGGNGRFSGKDDFCKGC